MVSDSLPTYFFIGCSAKKRAEPDLTLHLYTGDLFQLCRSYAIAVLDRDPKKYDRIFVLSALWCLLPARRWVDPYNVKLEGAEYCRAWQKETLAEILAAIPAEPCRIVVLAGVNYRGWIEEARKLRPDWQVEVPLEGLGIGRQKQRLKQLIEEAANG